MAPNDEGSSIEMSNLLEHSVGQSVTNLADTFSDPPSSSFWAKWLGGLVFPLLFAIYSGKCMITQQGTLIGRDSNLELTGSAAVALGVSAAGIAVFLHTHYCWGNSRFLAGLSELGKVIGLLLFIGGLVTVIWQSLT
jgi:hypothetical protein